MIIHKCARCGSEPNVKKIITGRTDRRGRMISYYEVVCGGCGTKTIRHSYQRDAVIDWNQLQRSIAAEEAQKKEGKNDTAN